jgi:small subunit ribosomal protein S16
VESTFKQARRRAFSCILSLRRKVMAVAIRLRRTGAKKRPFYRIVVADTAKRRSGQYIESVGYYNPITNPATVEIDAELAIAWLDRGALPTETARSLLAKAGVIAQWQARKSGATGEATE